MIQPTHFIESDKLNRYFNARITIASEVRQHTGSFKFRAAFHVAKNVNQTHIITASSGNFGQAMALACSLTGKKCTVIMPIGSTQVKIDGVKNYGGEVRLVDTKVKSRLEYLHELEKEFPDAYVASPYDDPLVIDGNKTLGIELAEKSDRFDSIIVPIGGGGLSSGIIRGFEERGKTTEIYGAEPLLANDAARSLKAGKIISNEVEPATIADGARTLKLGIHNWPILKRGLKGIIEVPEDKIKQGVRLLFQFAKIVSEPTGALSIGALLTEQEAFKGRSICCIVSGGNVDRSLYAQLIG